MSTYERGYRSQQPGKTGGTSEQVWHMRRRGHGLMYIADVMGLTPEMVLDALTVAASARDLSNQDIERTLIIDQFDMLFQKTYELANMSDEKTAASHMRNAFAILQAKARVVGIEGLVDKSDGTTSEVDAEIKRLIRDLERYNPKGDTSPTPPKDLG